MEQKIEHPNESENDSKFSKDKKLVFGTFSLGIIGVVFVALYTFFLSNVESVSVGELRRLLPDNKIPQGLSSIKTNIPGLLIGDAILEPQIDVIFVCLESSSSDVFCEDLSLELRPLDEDLSTIFEDYSLKFHSWPIMDNWNVSKDLDSLKELYLEIEDVAIPSYRSRIICFIESPVNSVNNGNGSDSIEFTSSKTGKYVWNLMRINSCINEDTSLGEMAGYFFMRILLGETYTTTNGIELEKFAISMGLIAELFEEIEELTEQLAKILSDSMTTQSTELHVLVTESEQILENYPSSWTYKDKDGSNVIKDLKRVKMNLLKAINHPSTSPGQYYSEIQLCAIFIPFCLPILLIIVGGARMNKKDDVSKTNANQKKNIIRKILLLLVAVLAIIYASLGA
eukprot:TRINITY_DN17385_c0_g1_i1.p1 TRINITY_DN17385_c0_g1~~TRINITY_DN17385_c0_g1_i1.p1  ORF type:complete len:398 (-),score=56.10 TRINITY_DN17385_c0_g1_i1:312-1505(-)